ncbi:class I SAM-dependent methyltransferase [Sphaerisporangium sp. TRM90804]|uniref:class I SAM-dependent methyltransferase n=1 Tax=Sphaerisporangium sp. TRM90804 TaxID=3031113 RepID=UPI0024486D0A|nr:class I SAM-dependent methyltransferase [Sphaerisporangium sp. TRM90804]MDH2425988.1 methyltransferase domain-containing protein [Sphaerisporangium sp. TRM90804]
MVLVRNSEQFNAWNGAEGSVWAGRPSAEHDVDVLLAGRLLEAAGIGARDRVLDIGCGTGQTTRMAARLTSEGHVAGVDLSEPMLEQARLDALAAGLGDIVFEQADAQVHRFAEGSFDVAVSRYGVMFFAEPVAAFANIGRALRPGGRLAFVCPQPPEDCAWYVVPVAALLGLPPRDAVSAYPGPAPAMFSLSDPAHADEVLTRAGFTDVSVEPAHLAHHFGWTAAEAADTFLASGPSRYIVEQDGELSWEEARTRLTTALEPYAGPAGVLLPGAQWLVSAVWPAGAAREG